MPDSTRGFRIRAGSSITAVTAQAQGNIDMFLRYARDGSKNIMRQCRCVVEFFTKKNMTGMTREALACLDIVAGGTDACRFFHLCHQHPFSRLEVP